MPITKEDGQQFDEHTYTPPLRYIKESAIANEGVILE
jgi:hypothetical protein